MSAHSRPLTTLCEERWCGRRATEQVYNTYSAEQGKFCKKHAAARVKELKAGEKGEKATP